MWRQVHILEPRDLQRGYWNRVSDSLSTLDGLNGCSCDSSPLGVARLR